MKYVLMILSATILFLIFGTVFLIYGIWIARFDAVKNLYSEYHKTVARHMYKGFKINIY